MNKYVKAFLIIFATVTIFLIFTQGYTESGGCDDPQIKGNKTTYNGEKIYHTPDGQFYDVTDAEEMFCSEEDAEAAGYRMSER